LRSPSSAASRKVSRKAARATIVKLGQRTKPTFRAGGATLFTVPNSCFCPETLRVTADPAKAPQRRSTVLPAIQDPFPFASGHVSLQHPGLQRPPSLQEPPWPGTSGCTDSSPAESSV